MYDTNLKRKWDNQAALEYDRHEGMEKGNVPEIRNLIAKLRRTNEKAADVSGVTIAFVKSTNILKKK